MREKTGLGRLLVIILTISLLGGCNATTTASASSKETTKQATVGDLLIGLSYDGKIKLPVTNLNFEVEGIIKEIYVSAGDVVKKGDVLAELDDTDLQSALKTAQINLDKATVAYEDAVTSAGYNLKVEKANLESLQKKAATAFDDYTYTLAISNAEITLARKQSDLADAKKTLAKAEAAAPLDEYSYNLAISNAKITLERKQADLEDAKKTLTEAQTKKIDPFDDYTYQNAIRTAQTAYDRALEEYYLDPTTKAKNTMDDAELAVKTAYDNMVRAKDKYETDEKDAKQDEIDAAQKKVTTAQQAVDDAQDAYDNANTSFDRALSDGTDKLLDDVEAAESKVAAAKQAVDDAELSLKNAQESLARAIVTYNKDMETTKESLATQELKYENITNSTAAITNARYNVEDAENKLQTAQNDLEKIKITAPIDGKILNVSKNVGEVVAATTSSPIMNFGTSSNSGVITICDTSQIYLSASVTEGDIVSVTPGQTIKVTVDALGDDTLTATVYTVSSIPSTDSSGIITYEVIGKLDTLNESVKDNMSAFLTFVQKEKQNVLMIPNKAVTVEGTQQYVNVKLENGTIEKRAVTGGLSNGTQTEIIEGLDAGETVVVGGGGGKA